MKEKQCNEWLISSSKRRGFVNYISLKIDDFRTARVLKKLKLELENCTDEKERKVIKYKMIMVECLSVGDYNLYVKNAYYTED